jgi:tetratricopeptide (TPR) repeat protein
VKGSLRAGVAVLLWTAGVAQVSCARRAIELPGPRSAPTVRRTLASGDALRRSGRTEEAAVVYARAVESDPASVPAHVRHVEALLALGRRSEARRIYEARAAAPGATDADRTMAARLATDGASSSLRDVYAAAAARSPNEPWWRLATAEVEMAEADAWNRRRAEAVSLGDRKQERKALEQSRGALRRGGRAVEEAAALAPRLAEVELYRGLLRAVEGDLHAGATAKSAAYRAAEEAFLRATCLDPDLVEAWDGLGDVRYRNGDVRESLEAWREAVQRAPGDAHLRVSLGVVLHEIERHTDAVEQYRAAALLEPHDGSIWVRIGDAYADGERWDPALDAYEEALRRDPRELEALQKSGRVLEAQGRWADARQAYERYVAEGGADASAAERRIDRLLRAECPR